MINLNTFIKQCERDLVLQRKLSEATLSSINNLSDRNKILCKPILNFIEKGSIDMEVDTKDIQFSSEERILVCRLIPLIFALDTNNPTWSSYMLTQAIKASNDIIEINLSELGIAFLEILCEFSTPLNKVVYNFIMDFLRELTIRYRKRLHEFDTLVLWKNARCQLTASVAFLRFFLTDSQQLEFVLKTILALIQNEYFAKFMEMTRYLFEDSEYKQAFLEYLFNSELSKRDKDLILAAVNA